MMYKLTKFKYITVPMLGEKYERQITMALTAMAVILITIVMTFITDVINYLWWGID